MKKNLAIVGYGGQGAWHASHAEKSDVVSLSGIFDIAEKRVLAAKERGIRAYTTLEELLTDESVDIVLCATPNDSHKKIVLAALAAGKHVICEKPVALSVSDFDEMTAAAEKAGRLLSVHQNRRWDVDFLAIKSIIASGEIGEVISVESRIHGSRGIPSDWRCHKAPGGGMILDWGVHLIDQMLGIVYDKKIESLYCRFDHITNDEVDDGFSCELRYEGDLTVHLYVGTSNFIDLPRWYMQGENGTAVIRDWDINGEIVMVSDWENRDAVPIQAGVGLTKTMAPRTDKTIQKYPLPYVEKVSFSDENRLYNNLCDALEGKAEQFVTHDQQRRLIRVVEAMFESAEKNEVIKF